MRGSFDQPGDADARRDTAEAGDTGAEQETLRLAWPEAVCGRIQPLLETFHDGALDAADERFVREHVVSCARCAARLRRYDEVDTVLRYAPAPQVGPELRTRLYSRIAATQQQRSICSKLGLGRKQVGARVAHERTSSWGAGTRSPAPRGAAGIGGAGLITNWLNGVAAIAVVALLALLFNTLTGMPNRARTSSEATITGHVIGTLTELPSMSDYHAAFLDHEGQLHFVSADHAMFPPATQIHPGLMLPNAGLLMRVPAAPYYAAAASQDGHYLAYVEGDASVRSSTTALPDGGPVAIVNLVTGVIVSMPVRVNDLSWSPDNHFLVAPDASTSSAAVYIIDARAGSAHTITPSFNGTQALVPLVAGWIDAAHVAVFYQQGGSTSTPTPQTPTAPPTPSPTASLVASQTASPAARTTWQRLGSMDVNSGTISYLADLPDPSDVFLSPDGQKALLAPNYYTRTAQVVDTKTGHIQALPNIAAAFAGKFVDFVSGSNWSLHSAWQPGAGHVLAISLSIGNGTIASRQESGIWLLDLDNDSATQVLQKEYPLAWFPSPPQALVTCDPPEPDDSGAYPRDGAGVGTKVYEFSPVMQGGEFAPAGGGMAAFLGLVRTK